jgi:hypothetical protein
MDKPTIDVSLPTGQTGYDFKIRSDKYGGFFFSIQDGLGKNYSITTQMFQFVGHMAKKISEAKEVEK